MEIPWNKSIVAAKLDTVATRSRRILALAFSLARLCSILTWLALHPDDPGFHGKPEGEWIKGISYFGDEAQEARAIAR
jgi:hypothetical protein